MEPPLYEQPRRVSVSDGHVLVESQDGTMLKMTPEVALELSRRLGAAGADSLINRVMHSHVKDREF